MSGIGIDFMQNLAGVFDTVLMPYGALRKISVG